MKNTLFNGNSSFERTWGEKIREAAKKSDIKKYEKYFPKGKEFDGSNKLIRTYALIQDMHRKKEKGKEQLCL